MLILGLTGSIGSGKTTISGYFKEKNIEIVDADQIARESTAKGQKGLSFLVSEFGQDILSNDGELDRLKLRNLIFKDQKLLDRVNKILHPIIIDMIKDEIKRHEDSGEGVVVVDAPLLIETGLNEIVDRILLVCCDEKVQVERIMKRDGVDSKKALMIIRKQMSQDEKKTYSDFVIDNSGTLEDLKREFGIFYKNLEEWIEEEES